MDSLTKALVYVFLAGSMLGIGLKVGKDEILTVFRDKGWLVRTVIANFVLIPALGILVARALAVKPENELAFVVLACAPGGISALQFLTKQKRATALAYGGGTMIVLSALAIFISPFLIGLVVPEELGLTIPYGLAILFLSLSMLLPLLLGIFVRRVSESIAGKLAVPVSLIATLAFIVGMIRLLSLTKWARGEVGARALFGIVVFVLVSMLIGWLLGGPTKFTRPILATVSSTRNGALALAITIRSFDATVVTPIVAFIAIMIPLNLLGMIAMKVIGKKTEKELAGS